MLLKRMFVLVVSLFLIFSCGVEQRERDCQTRQESCNGKDDNCNGKVDEGCDCIVGKTKVCGSDIGVCKTGLRTCDVYGHWSDCVGNVSKTKEVCNGKDDDCDGKVDETCDCIVDKIEVCGTNVGVCKTGLRTCGHGKWGDCIGSIAKTEELCNGGKDDDCDGLVDEGCMCKHGEKRVCGTNLGICKTGTQHCLHGKWRKICVGGLSSKKEVCNGKDDDCDGIVDEASPAKGKACIFKLGDCKASGVFVCLADGRGVFCDAKIRKSKIEVCNGKDDDCDGIVDNNEATKKDCYYGRKGTKGVGICKSGYLRCKNGKLGLCVGQVFHKKEICNGKDDDCDGKTDEVCDCIVGKIEACGSSLGTCKTGLKTCNNFGRWEVCRRTYASKKEICNGKDDDCDGLIDDGILCVKGFSCSRDQNKCVLTKNIKIATMLSPPAGKRIQLRRSLFTWVQVGAAEYRLSIGSKVGLFDLYDTYIRSYNWKLVDAFLGVKRTLYVRLWTKVKGAWKGNYRDYVFFQDCVKDFEICNNLDDDCDGKIDNDVPRRSCGNSCGIGAEICVKGAWKNCTAPKRTKEVCNGKDDDCDGKIDEGFPCCHKKDSCGGKCTNLLSDFLSCGKCDLACPSSYSCIKGKCVRCNEWESACENSCTNTYFDSKNCGKCGNSCASGESCINKKCRKCLGNGGSCSLSTDCCSQSCVSGKCKACNKKKSGEQCSGLNDCCGGCFWGVCASCSFVAQVSSLPCCPGMLKDDRRLCVHTVNSQCVRGSDCKGCAPRQWGSGNVCKVPSSLFNQVQCIEKRCYASPLSLCGKVEDCLAGYTCQGYSCLKIPRQGKGEICAENRNCKSDLICRGHYCMDKLVKKRLGESCSLPEDCAGTRKVTCRKGTCQLCPKIGASCSKHSECCQNRLCVGGRCTDKCVRKLGGLCHRARCCYPALVCDTLNFFSCKIPPSSPKQKGDCSKVCSGYCIQGKCFAHYPI